MKTLKDPATRKGVLVQLRLTSKNSDTLSPYDAYDLLVAALKNSKDLVIEQAEFRAPKDEETSI